MNKHFSRALLRDLTNRIRFGPEAPRYGERIHVPAGQSRRFLPSRVVETRFGQRLRRASGRVVEDWPDDALDAVENQEKVRVCLSHWRDGQSWEQAGAYDYMMQRIQGSASGRFDGCASLNEVKARYERLDRLFLHLRQGGAFATMEQLIPGNFREVGGVLFHIDALGEPVFGGGGAHRFAMAQVLGLSIPAQVGLVHRAAIPLLPGYRSPL